MKQQINFRASDLTARQLDWLMQRWGTSQTETMTVVIDRIFQQENKTMNIRTQQDSLGGWWAQIDDSDGNTLAAVPNGQQSGYGYDSEAEAIAAAEKLVATKRKHPAAGKELDR